MALPPSKFASLFSVVHCPFLTLRVVHTSPVHPKPVGGLPLVLIHINPYIFLKTVTIPTYHSISIAVPRYIAMQLPFTLHDLLSFIILYIALHDSIQLMCGFTHVTLDHCTSCYTGRGIQFHTSCFVHYELFVPKKCVVILECCP